jgi:D-aminopeptidase
MDAPPPPRPRARDLGIEVGARPPGPTNAIVDVPGVRVGHVTRWEGDSTRTGVTAVLPGDLVDLWWRPMASGSAVLNGTGELTGALKAAEWGQVETPILLTSTGAVGRGYDAVVDAVFDAVPEAGVDHLLIPMVGECDDSWLDEARLRAVTVADARAAIDSATAEAPALGVVGAGTGMVSFGVKGGIGSASRHVEELDATLGVLLLANHGDLPELTVAGEPYGRRLQADGFVDAWAEPEGSCVVILATDAPLDAHGCRRLARRAGLGLARGGSIAHHGSGEIFTAFSTTVRGERRPSGPTTTRTVVHHRAVDALFAAAVEAVEEAALDALLVSDTVSGFRARTAPGLPHP